MENAEFRNISVFLRGKGAGRGCVTLVNGTSGIFFLARTVHHPNRQLHNATMRKFRQYQRYHKHTSRKTRQKSWINTHDDKSRRPGRDVSYAYVFCACYAYVFYAYVFYAYVFYAYGLRAQLGPVGAQREKVVRQQKFGEKIFRWKNIMTNIYDKKVMIFFS